MPRRMIDMLDNAFERNLQLVQACINNSDEKLWEKQVSGYYYWDLIYHTLIATATMLKIDDENEIYKPISNAGNLDGKADPKEPHDKSMMSALVGKTKVAAKKYLKTMNDEMLHDLSLFYGKKITRARLVLITLEHIQYHIGGCDVALRDNNCKAVLLNNLESRS